MKRRSPTVTRVAVALLGATTLALAGCAQEGHFSNPDGSLSTGEPTFTRGPSSPTPTTLPTVCNQLAERSTRDSFVLPTTLGSKCVWGTRNVTSAVVTGNTLVALISEDGRYRVDALDMSTGKRRWRGADQVVFGQRSSDSRTPYETGYFGGAPILILAHKGSKAYVAMGTDRVSPADAVNSGKTERVLRFYPAAGKGTVEPKTYVGDSDMRYQTSGDRDSETGYVLLRSTQDSDLVSVDPETGKGTTYKYSGDISDSRREEPVQATAAGSVVTSFERDVSGLYSGSGVAVRDAEGKVVWTTVDDDNTPKDVIKGSAKAFGSFGGYVIVQWRQGDPESSDVYAGAPVVALHDAKSGEVVAEQRFAESDDKITGQAATAVPSPDGRYLVVGNAVFDLKTKKALKPLPDAVRINSVGPDGTAYGSGNSSRGVAIALSSGKVLWDGEPTDEVPLYVGEDTALVPFEAGYAAFAIKKSD